MPVEPGYLLATLTGGYRYRSAGLNNREVGGNGFDANRVLIPGTTPRFYTAGIATPTGSPSGAGAGAGAVLLAGTYRYGITYYDPTNLRESNMLEFNVTIASDQTGINLSSIPTDGSATTTGTAHRRVYRTQLSGTTASTFYLVAAIADNTTATYSDTMTDATLITQTTTHPKDLTVGVVMNLFVEAFGKLFGANSLSTTAASSIYWSKAGNGEYWPASNTISLRSRGGSSINALGKVGPNVLAFLHDSILRTTESGATTGDGSATYFWDPIPDSSVGTVSPASLRNIVFQGKEWLAFSSEKGMYLTDGNGVMLISKAIEAIFASHDADISAKPWVPRLDTDKTHNIVGYYLKRTNEMAFVLPLDTDNAPTDTSLLIGSTDSAGANDGVPILHCLFSLDRKEWRFKLRRTLSATEILGTGEINKVWEGDNFGEVSECEGWDTLYEGETGGTLSGTITSVGSSSMSDSTATFWTGGDGLTGVPIIMGAENGTWKLVWITSNTATSIEYTNPDGNQSVTNSYYIASVPYWLKLPWISPAALNHLLHLSSAVVSHRNTSARLQVRWFMDEGDRLKHIPNTSTGDASLEGGTGFAASALFTTLDIGAWVARPTTEFPAKATARNGACSRIGFEILAYKPGEKVEVYSLEVQGVEGGD